jgi:beta-N-acetylhexosaminidase
MHKPNLIKYVFIIVIISLFIITGCGVLGNGAKSDIPDSETPEKEKGIDPIIQKIDKMTLDEKIGQLMLVGIEGYEIDERTKQLIHEHRVGGVILYRKNISDAKQLLSLINSLKKSNFPNTPLFISVDEEGGSVSRMPDELHKIPSAEIIGGINEEQLSFELGAVIAEEIKSFGFNMNFAPVLDINSNPNNPVIGNRAFGSEPEVVSRLGIMNMKGIQSKGVIPVVKHFPGHGDTAIDSHIGLPIVHNGLERLNDFELVPFKRAIENNADAVMIAHILLPEIDKENPASMSKIVITEMLKDDLGFEGIVVTDDMTMGAIVEHYSIEDAAIKSLDAGADVILVAHEYEKQIRVINAIKNAVKNSDITKKRIDESVYKVLKLKEKYDLNNDIIDSVDIEKINEKIDEILNKYVSKYDTY